MSIWPWRSTDRWKMTGLNSIDWARRAWEYQGNDWGYLIFSHVAGMSILFGLRYELDRIGEAETVQQFLDRHGEREKRLAGFQRDYAVFVKPLEDLYCYEYSVVTLTPEQTPDVITSVGGSFDQYATTIKAE